MGEIKAQKFPELKAADIDRIVTRLDSSQTDLNHSPCRNAPDRCLEPHQGEGAGWDDMNPNRMCVTCAAYWHIAVAANLLRRHKMILLSIEAEDQAHEVAEALEAKLPEGVVVGEEERATIKEALGPNTDTIWDAGI